MYLEEKISYLEEIYFTWRRNILLGGEIFYLEEKGSKTFSVRRVMESWPSMAQPLTLETKQPSNVATDSRESNVAMDPEESQGRNRKKS